MHIPPPRQPPDIWHALDLQELLTLLGTGRNGLSQEEAQKRLRQYGPNSLPPPKKSSWLSILFRQFTSPLILILLIAALLSALIHPESPADALFIIGVLILNAVIGTYQEGKAEQTSTALLHLLHIHAQVIRDEEVVDIDAEHLVPGDIAWLETGNRVPADIRLIQTHSLEIDESLLTGESLPVLKKPSWLGEATAPIADHQNMAYAGSVILRGRAKGVVVATGLATIVGQLTTDVLRSSGGRPPLIERMDKFTRVIAISILLAIILIGTVGIFLHGYPLIDMVFFGVALAVSAIPEGLPVALTVTLAIATTRMTGRGVIVRRLAAVEGLGSCTLIGSDKTGTLTCNELTVRTIVLANGISLEVTGEGFAPEGEVLLDKKELPANTFTDLYNVAQAAVLCNEGSLYQRHDNWRWRGDPLDVALLSMGVKVGLSRETALNQYPQINEIPFEPEYQYAATFHQEKDHVVVFVKGAPERVLGLCKFSDNRTKTRKMAEAASIAKQGYRVIALATATLAYDLDQSHVPPEPNDLTLLGFIGLIDPLRPGVHQAITTCRRSGIVVIVITGDHPDTALAIGRELGIAHDPEQVLTGQKLATMDMGQRSKALETINVFARVTPRQKLELVQTAQHKGHYVAVTGDGVNDAPALRQANIGVAMGRSGTDVAKESAELVISDDNFATLVAGIEEGRIAYDNVRKVIYLLVSTGAAEVILLGLTVTTGWPNIHPDQPLLPLLPAQLLWLNLVTNGIQDVALAFEPGESGTLQRPPRPPHERIFNRLMVERTLLAALVMAGVSYATFSWMIVQTGWSATKARSGLLFLMVLFEIVHIGNCRSERISALHLSPLKSPILLTGTILALLIHATAMHIPFMQRLLHIEPLAMTTYAILMALSLSILLVMEIHKWWLNEDAA